VHARQPDECGHLFADLIKRAKLEELVAMYESGATVAMNDGTSITGHGAIRDWLRQVLAAGTIDLNLKVVKLVQSGELAVTHTDWSATTRAADGTVTASSGKALEVVRQQADGRWLYVVDDPFGRG
jgi:ketosteroid isomerase-like protein